MTSHGHENSHGRVSACCAGFPQYPRGGEPVRCYCAGTSGTVATSPEDHCAECRAAGCAEWRKACLFSPLATSGTLTLQFENRPAAGAEKLDACYILKDGETFERDVLPIRCRAKYQQHIETIRRVAREHGYAIGVHGSIRRDIDLIAAPWTEEASDGETLAAAIAGAVEGVIDMGSVPGRGKSDDHEKPEEKPHGRMCWTIHLGGGPYIDLSVMPLSIPVPVAENESDDYLRGHSDGWAARRDLPTACESPLHVWQIDVPAEGGERCLCGEEAIPATAASAPVNGEALARQFHAIYERVASSFGYSTREETREFDPSSPNGRLMIAVCSEILASLTTPERYDACDDWTNAFNSFSAGQEWGRKNPDCGDEGTINACIAHADSVAPHECPPPEPEATP